MASKQLLITCFGRSNLPNDYINDCAIVDLQNEVCSTKFVVYCTLARSVISFLTNCFTTAVTSVTIKTSISVQLSTGTWSVSALSGLEVLSPYIKGVERTSRLFDFKTASYNAR